MVLSLVNQKGGVGKTTTAVSLTAAMHDLGKRVLLCDFDPQANATSGFGVEKTDVTSSIYDVIINDVPAKDAVISTKYGDLIPSGAALAGAGIELVSLDRREFRLKDALEPLKKDYDYIFIDCPPSLELLTLNALCAADQVIVPVQCEYYALEGLSDLMGTLRAVKRTYQPNIGIFGLVLTMYDGRTNLSIRPGMVGQNRNVSRETSGHAILRDKGAVLWQNQAKKDLARAWAPCLQSRW